jgi:hypothetical protein
MKENGHWSRHEVKSYLNENGIENLQPITTSYRARSWTAVEDRVAKWATKKRRKGENVLFSIPKEIDGKIFFPLLAVWAHQTTAEQVTSTSG